MNINDFIKLDCKDEQPLDHYAVDGGLCGILHTVGCIGDSLSSGEFESLNEKGERGYHDMYDYSWGQFMARLCGLKVYNFSQGGMTAKHYYDTFADENGFWEKAKECKAFIIALGVNDILNQHQEIGTLEDICKEDYNKCKPTFLGYYGKIILRLKETNPHAKFFLVTMPRVKDEIDPNSERHRANEAISSLGEFFDRTYVIDLYKYAPVYDEDFKRKFFLAGHMDAVGYLLTARMIASYIDYIIRHNLDDFKQIGFVNTPYYNVDYKL